MISQITALGLHSRPWRRSQPTSGVKPARMGTFNAAAERCVAERVGCNSAGATATYRCENGRRLRCRWSRPRQLRWRWW
jgi:hypothetical protein